MPYQLLDQVSMKHDDHEERIELLRIDSTEWIRMCYWTPRRRKDGTTYLNLSPRPIMLEREQFRELFKRAIKKGILSKDDFLE
jgi:hypothetical protein